MNKCYNCDETIEEGQETREHIPAKNLYEGYSEEYKTNRIVVPACNSCNHYYSKLDQEFRDAIGVLNDTDDQQMKISEKATRSLVRGEKNLSRLNFENGRIAVSFEYDKFRELHIKNFKGVFYSTFGEPIPKSYKIEIVADGDEENSNLMEMTKVIYHELKKHPFLISGHENIFKYKIASIYETDGNLSFSTDNYINSMCIVCFQVIHDRLFSLTMSAENEFAERLRIKHKKNLS